MPQWDTVLLVRTSATVCPIGATGGCPTSLSVEPVTHPHRHLVLFIEGKHAVHAPHSLLFITTPSVHHLRAVFSCPPGCPAVTYRGRTYTSTIPSAPPAAWSVLALVVLHGDEGRSVRILQHAVDQGYPTKGSAPIRVGLLGRRRSSDTCLGSSTSHITGSGWVECTHTTCSQDTSNG